MRSALLLPLLLLAVLAVPLRAQDIFQEGTTITVELMNGDKLTGLLEHADQSKLVILHDVFGRIEVPRAAIKAAPPAPVEPVSPWSGKFDVALSGSSGNSTNQTFRTELDVKHEDDDSIDDFVLWYRHAVSKVESDDGNPATDDNDYDTTEGKLFSQLRHEWKLKDSKWRPFVQGSYERDQLADYEARAAIAGGAGYAWLDTEEHKLTGRLGAGVSRKFGSDDPDVEDTTYEALLGLDWAWVISETSNLTFNTDIYPSINPSGEIRSVSKLAYDVKVDPDSAWYMKLGLDHFYDSAAGDDKQLNDWNYYVGLGRTF